MKSLTVTLLSLTIVLAATQARAQQDLQPGVQTSSAAAPVEHPPGSPEQAPSAAPPSAKAPAARQRSKPAAQPAVPATTQAAPAAGSTAAATKGGKASDRIQLDTTEISGNRELPKVMYVVPWRRADPGDFNGRPLNSLLDEALTPVDRDVFRRQNRYYAALQAEPAATGSPPESKDEK